MRHLLTAMLIASFAAPAAGQPVRELSADEAVRLGLQHSRSVRAAAEQALETSERYHEARTARLPALNALAAYQRLSSNIPDFDLSVPGMPGLPSFSVPAMLNRYQFQLSVQQPLFTGFRIHHGIRSAEFQAEAASYDLDRAGDDAAFRIREAYWGLSTAIAVEDVVGGALVLIDALLVDLQNLREQGLATTGDVLAVQTRRSEVRLQQVDADNAVRLGRLNLSHLTGLPLDAEIVPVVTVEPAPPAESLESLIAEALQRRPEVLALESRVGALDAARQAAGAERFPQVALTGAYRLGRPNPYIFPPEDEFNGTWEAGVSVSFDVLNWGRTRSRTAQAQARTRAASEQLAELRETIRLDVSRRYLEVERSVAALSVAQQGVAEAEEALRVARDRLREGMARASEVLDAEVAYRTAELRRTQAVAAYAVSRAALDRAVGGRGTRN